MSPASLQLISNLERSSCLSPLQELGLKVRPSPSPSPGSARPHATLYTAAWRDTQASGALFEVEHRGDQRTLPTRLLHEHYQLVFQI